MEESIKTLPKTFRVQFSEVERWDPNSFHQIEWHWDKSVMAPLGKYLSIRKEKVPTEKYAFSDLMPITIHFDGSIEPRKISEDKKYTMDMFWARPGDIVVSKIDLKNGAVAIIPTDWDNAVVTNHFAIYEPDLKNLDPKYFHLLIQVSFFKEYLWRNKVGAEGRKEVKLGFFEALQIPIPPLSIQQKIVAYWEKAQQSILKTGQNSIGITKKIQSRFLHSLELSAPMKTIPPKCFTSAWNGFDRWSVSFNQTTLSMIDLALGKYPVVELGSILELVQYGTSEKANTKLMGTPVLRMNNIKDGLFDYSKLKHVELPLRSEEALVLEDGDILINRTNSKELVGKCAVFHDSNRYVFASYLIRLRCIEDKANPDYVAHIINSIIGRQQVDALSRQVLGQANINTQELRSLRIPLPSRDIQKALMKQIEADRSAMASTEQDSTLLEVETKVNIEKLILGTLSVEEL